MRQRHPAGIAAARVSGSISPGGGAQGKATAALSQLRPTLRLEAVSLVAVVAVAAVLVVVTPARTEAEPGVVVGRQVRLVLVLPPAVGDEHPAHEEPGDQGQDAHRSHDPEGPNEDVRHANLRRGRVGELHDRCDRLLKDQDRESLPPAAATAATPWCPPP